MKTTQMFLLNTPARILIRSMFMRFKVNVCATGEKTLCCKHFVFAAMFCFGMWAMTIAHLCFCIMQK